MPLNLPTTEQLQYFTAASAKDIFVSLGLGTSADFQAKYQSYMEKNALPKDDNIDLKYLEAYATMGAVRVVVWELEELLARESMGDKGSKKLVVSAISIN